MSETPLTPESEEEYEQRKQDLLEETAETKQELDEQQNKLLEDIKSEHGASEINTKVNIAGDHTATVVTKVDGNLIDELGNVDEKLNNPESMKDATEAMEEASQILADMIAEDSYNKTLFMGVYQSEGPIAIANIVEVVFEAIKDEMETKRGAVDGFRAE